MFDSFADVSEI